MEHIRLMSHNQWYCNDNTPAWKEKGLDCSAAVRERGFARVYDETHPDIVGLQEVSGRMAEELMAALETRGLQYALLWGHDTPILYRPDRFELVDSFFALYPDHCPGLEGTFNNQNSKSRTLGVFRCKRSGAVFLFASTHLWWKENDPSHPLYQKGSDEARIYQLGLAMDDIDRMRKAYGNCPAVLVGDLNNNYRAPCLRSAFDCGYRHAHDVAVDFADSSRGYHSCTADGFRITMEPGGFEDAIDHILLTDGGSLSVRRFERYTPDYYMALSDHSPVFIDAELYL